MGAVITTSWDDGHPLDLRVARMLADHRLPGTFYVPRRADSGTMSVAELRELAGQFEIGGHTLDHRPLTGLADADAQRQIADSRSWVQDTTGKPCTMFCPPAGKFAPRHLRMVREAGYVGLRTVELLSTARPVNRQGVRVIGTTIQAYPHSALAYGRNGAKRGAWGGLLRYALHGFPGDWERLADALMRDVIASGGVFHLWGHSWEIERTGQWERLDRVLRRLDELFPPEARLDNGELCRSVLPRSHRDSLAATSPS